MISSKQIILPFIIVSCAIAFSVQPAHSQSLLDKIFSPQKEDENIPKPEDTLVSPFENPELYNIKPLPLPENVIQPEAENFSAQSEKTRNSLIKLKDKKDNSQAQALTENLENPHRSRQHIRRWIITGVSEATSFKNQPLKISLAQKRPLFSRSGWAQYQDFLKKMQISETLQSKQFFINSFAQSQPSFLNEGKVNGSYKWLYEAPVMMSYIRDGQDLKESAPVNQLMTLTVQVGRNTGTENEDGLLIEQWSAKLKKAEN